MEEKLRVEENTRQALCRYGGDAAKTAIAVGRPVSYVKKIQKKMKGDLDKNPSTNIQIASNITTLILEGRQQRRQMLQDMYNTLENREQLIVCPICKTEVGEFNESSGTYYCPVCGKHISGRIMDRDIVMARKQLLIDSLYKEDDGLMNWLVKMGWVGKEAPPGPQTIVHSRQNVLVLGGSKDGKISEQDAKTLDDIRHLPPLEAEKLRKDLKSEIIGLDARIRDAEKSEVERAEEAEGSSPDVV